MMMTMIVTWSWIWHRSSWKKNVRRDEEEGRDSLLTWLDLDLGRVYTVAYGFYYTFLSYDFVFFIWYKFFMGRRRRRCNTILISNGKLEYFFCRRNSIAKGYTHKLWNRCNNKPSQKKISVWDATWRINRILRGGRCTCTFMALLKKIYRYYFQKKMYGYRVTRKIVREEDSLLVL